MKGDELIAAFNAPAAASSDSADAAASAEIIPDPNPGAIAEYCSTGPTRFGSCLGGTAIANSFDTRTGAITGTSTTQVIYWATLSNRTRGWVFEAKAVVQDVTGKLQTGTSMSMFAVCTSGCQAATDTSTIPVVRNQFVTNRTNIASLPAGSDVTSSDQLLRLVFTNPQVTGNAQVTTPSLGEVRCDQGVTLGATAAPGCVYPEFTPTFLLDGAADPPSPLHAAFVARAQASLPDRWGAPGSTPLRRIADGVQRDANRTKACRGFVPIDKDDSCDEYPFASTEQSTLYGGTNRAAVDHVPGRDNSNGGVKLSQFNVENRVLDGDYYFVQVVG